MSANDVYSKLRTAPDYHPASVDLFDDCTLQAGDVVTVQSGEDSYLLPIFSQHMVWNGAPTVELESTGNEKRNALPALRKKAMDSSYELGLTDYEAAQYNSGKFSGYDNKMAGYDEEWSEYRTWHEETDQLIGQYAAHFLEGDVPDFWTAFEQTASAISMRAYRAELDETNSVIGEFYAEFTVTACEIRSEVIATQSDYHSLVTQTASSIRSELWTADSALYSTIMQTAESIRSEVANADSGLYSVIMQTASSIRSELGNAESGIYSTINQTASNIRSEVARSDSSMWSAIEQNESGISSKVGYGEVISAINQTAETVSISASKIDLSGYVTASELQSTNANISNLTSGNTKATKLWATTLSCDTLTVAGSTTASITNGLSVGGSLSVGGTLSITDNGSSYNVHRRSIIMTGAFVAGSKVVFGPSSDNLDLTHSHSVSVDANGNVTIGNPQTTSGTFNIADTAYFQQQMSAYQENGWALARSYVSPPGSNTSSASCTFGVPSVTYDNGSSYTYTVSCDDSYAYIKNASNVTVARVSNGAYDNGWAAARAKVDPPGSNTTNAYFDFAVPGSATGTTGTYRYTVSCDSSYAYIKNASNVTVARVSNSAYSAGWSAARGKVSEPDYNVTSGVMSVGVPSATVDNSASLTYTLSCGMNYAYITKGTGTSGTVVARVSNPVTLTTTSITSNGTYYASSDGYSGYSSVTVNVPTASYSSSDLHISKSSGKILLYLGNRVIERTASIQVTSLVKSSSSNMYTITVLIDGDTTFTFSKLPS